MANKNFTLNFDASMNISQIKSAISEMQRAFSGLKLSQGLNTNIQNVFSKINSELEKFEDLTSKSFHSLSDVSKASSSFERIIDYYKQLEKYGKEITGMDKEKFFPDSVVSNITKANKALQTYYRELEAIPAEIEKANKALAKQEATLDSLTQKRNALAAENKSLGSTKGGISRKITAKEAEQSNLTAQMSSLEASGTKKSSAEYKALASQYNILTQELKKLKSEATELDSTMAKNRATIASLDSQINSTTTNISQLKQELGQMTQSLNTASLDKLRNSLAEITGQDISQISSDIKQIQTIINGLSDEELQRIKVAFDNIQKSAENAGGPISKTKSNLDSFGDTATTIVKTADEVQRLQNQVMDFFSISNAVQLFKRTIQSAFDTVQKLDAAMTETAVVTDFSIGDMWDSLPQYTDTANELGATIQGVYETMTLFYQQGLNTTETFEIGTETLKMARIAGLDYAQTTDLMTAALRGFNMELNATSAQRINDVYSELAAITASDTEEIATAMTKTASIAASANMEFETTAAFLAQMIETTRESAENLGTAMKTIIARFTEIKKDPTGIVEVEGETASFNDIEDALRSVGVTLTDTNGKFRDLDDVFLDLSGKWNTLDIMQQRYIATVAAGSRQQSRFIAMMNNYERTIELVNAANNSAGASEEQFGKTMESLEAKLNKLKNAWNQFTMGIMDSTVIKFGVDLLTQILTAINNITEALPGPIDGFAKLGIAILGLKAGKAVLNSFFSSIGKHFFKKGKDAANEFDKGFTSRIEKVVKKTNKIFTKDFWVGFKDIKPPEVDASSLQTLSAAFTNMKEGADAGGAAYSAALQQVASSLGATTAQQVAFTTAMQAGVPIEQAALALTNEQVAANILAANSKMQEAGATTTQTAAEIRNTAATSAEIAAQNASNASVATGLLTRIKYYAQLLFGNAAIRQVAASKLGLTAATTAEAVATTGASTAQWSLNAALLACPIGWIIAGVAALVALFVTLSSTMEDNSAAAKMEAAAEATERAEAAANATSEAYDNLMSSFDEYDNAQEALQELTKNTQEWKQALLEANQQVLEMLETYPELAKYTERGEYGQLTITEEGRQKQVEAAEQGVLNSSALSINADIQTSLAQNVIDKEHFEKVFNDRALRIPSGVENEINELLKIYKNNEQLFDKQQVTEESFNQMSKEEQKKLMSNYGYFENQADLFLDEIKRGGVFKFSDDLLVFAEKMAKWGDPNIAGTTPTYTGEGSAVRAEAYTHLEKDFVDYLVEYKDTIGIAQKQVIPLLTARVSDKVTSSEEGNKLAEVFSENYVKGLEEEIKTTSHELYHSGSDTDDDEKIKEMLRERGVADQGEELANLQALYADMLQTDVDSIDESIKDDKRALADAIANMTYADEFSSKLEDFYQKAIESGTETSKEFVNLLGKDISKVSAERLQELAKLDEQGVQDYLNTVAEDLDMSSIDELAESLGMDVQQLTSSFAKSIDLIKNTQEKLDGTLAQQFFSSGATSNSQDVIATMQKLTDKQKLFMVGNADAIQTQLGDSETAEFLVGMSDIYTTESAKVAEQAEAIISSIDWSNPIDAVYQLNKATESTEPKIQALGASLLVAGEDAFGAGEQFRYFLQSAEFIAINEDLSELVEKNGELTPQNVEELAQSSGLLSRMLDNVDVSAGGVAKTLTALNKGKIEIDDITDSLLVAISNFDGLNEVVNNAINTIENFNPGVDEGSVGDWVSDVRESVTEMYENGEYGNTQLQNYLKLLFGEEEWNKAIQEFDGNLQKVEESFVNRLDVLDQNLYGSWQELATNSKYQQGLKEFNQSMGTNIDIFMNDDGSVQLDTNGATTEQVVSSIMKAYNVSREYAEMMLADFKNYSADLQYELAQNDWAAGLEDYVKARTITTGYQEKTGPVRPGETMEPVEQKTAVFTDKEVQKMAAVTGKEVQDIWIGIANTVAGVDNKFKDLQSAQDYLAQQGVVLELLDAQGNLKSISEINTELNTKLGEGSSWASSFKKAGSIAIEDMQTMLSSFGIPEGQMEQLIIQQIEEAGPETTFTVGGVELGKDDLENLKTDYKGTIEKAQKEADATLYADKVAEALTGLDVDWTNVKEEAQSSFSTVYDTINEKINKAQKKINSLHGTNISVGVNIKPNQSGIKIGDEYVSISAYKKGSKGLPSDQLGILGDGNGAELVIGKDGTARVVGKNGPELTSLKKGDQIYTAEQTKKILSGTNEDEFPAYARGYTNSSSQTNKNTRKDEDSKSSSSGKSSDTKSKAEEEAEIWENTFDWLYNLTQDINEELREREKLEKKYNRLIEDRNKSATDILKNVRAQEASLEQQRKLQQQMYDKRKQEMQRTLSEYSDVSQYGTYNWSDNTVEINWDAIDKVTDTEKGERIEEYISKLEEIESQMDDAEDALDDIIDEIEELQKVGKDEYDDLESRVLDAIISREQEKIDKLSLIDESINDANTKLMNSIQSNLDKIRQDRQNQETEQSIEDNERRLAYLQQDTSGANALEIQQLQEELANQKQDYTDTLIDQKLSAIQEQNDKASEERQYQIELAQAQLEEAQKNGEFWNEAYRLIKEGTDATGKLVQNSDLTTLLKDGEAWESMSNIQKMDWLSELENTTKAAMVYFSSQRQLEKIGKTSGKITFTNANGEKLTGTVQKDGSVKVSTSKGTYTYKEVFQNYDGTYETLETNPSFKANAPSKPSNSGKGSGSIKVGGLINAGKAQIYDYTGDKSGERQYFLNDPIYKVLDEKNGYLLTRWHKLNTGYTGWFKKSDVKAYAKGGLADFTGPAWLDGTKSKPELVLNARDTENFIQLKDILSNLLRGDTSSGNSGDNYFEIHIDVDSLNNDYDVEQLATKIKKMINDDARYRNVNSINLLR